MCVVACVSCEEVEPIVPYTRVNHAKWMVTDSSVYVGTSNWWYVSPCPTTLVMARGVFGLHVYPCLSSGSCV